VPAYATTDDLTAYVSPDPVPAAVSTRLLARAAEAVDRITLGAIYDVDGDQLPTDARVLDALKRATCEQALFMAEAGDQLGTMAGIRKGTIGSVSFERDARAASGAGQVPYAPQAVTILRNEGLAPAYLTTW
jgi:hypothetical protein